MFFVQSECRPIIRAVGNRCAIVFEKLGLPGNVSMMQAISILNDKGFKEVDVDLMALARNTIGSAYKRGASLSEAPKVFDCSSLTKWLYGQLGISIPRRSIQQRDFGGLVGIFDVKPGDLIFSNGRIPYYVDNPKDGIGHVGIITDKKTVIHAANKKKGVVEVSLDEFTKTEDFRGFRRIVSDFSRLVVLEIPKERELETSDDIRWIIIQNLSKIKKPPR